MRMLLSRLVAEDGSRASVHFDQPRAQSAARELEQRLVCGAWRRGRGGVGAGGCGRVSGWPTRAVTVTTAPTGRAPERGSRQTLERIVRACATASRNESEFVRALREHDVRVRPQVRGGRAQPRSWATPWRFPGPTRGRGGRSGLAAGAWREI